jgi:hypothetical protein
MGCLQGCRSQSFWRCVTTPTNASSAEPLLCERHYVEHLDYLIKETRARERRLVHGINGIVPPEPGW